MAVRLGACLLPTSINLMLHGITVSEKFLMLVGAKVLNRSPLLFYCGTMPVSLLVDQRKMIFNNKTLRSTNTSCESFADCICMRPRDCFQSIMFFRGKPAT